MIKRLQLWLSLLALVVLSACGGASTNSDTTTTPPTVTAPKLMGTYQGEVTNQELRWCNDLPLDAGHGPSNCGMIYQLGGIFTFVVDGNHQLSGTTTLYGHEFPVCPGHTIDANSGATSFSFCVPGTQAAAVYGEGTFKDGKFTGELWEACCRFKNGFMAATKIS